MPDEVSHYRILRSLGHGGMGEVFLARDTRLQRDVALKMLPPDAADDPSRIQRLVREAHAVSAINHPNVAVIYAIDTDGEGRHFLAMEYVEGETLRDHITRGDLELPERIRIAREIADGLAEAHARGVIHRDLKPANVMITRRGRAKVLDFGLAKIATDADEHSSTDFRSEEGTVLGTTPYMSPEQALGRDVDARSDVFSFGTLLYELLSGTRPFSGRTASETIAHILHDPPPPLAIRDPAGPELERIARKCLEKDPALRYPSAQDLAVDLERLQRGSESGGTVAPPRAPRRGWMIVAAVAVVVAAIAVAAFFAMRRTAVPTAASIDSLAIIPFSQAGGTEDDYVVDGLSDEIINSVAQLPRLRVISRTTAFRYKGKMIDPQKVGNELNVAALLTGELRFRGGEVAVQTELVDARDGSHLWGQRYTTGASDLLSLHHRIATDLAQALGRGGGAALVAPRTVDEQAFRLYLKGRQQWNKRSYDGLRDSIRSFQAAIDRDPTYAQAYAGLADSYAVLGRYTDLSSEDSLPLAEAAARKALELDPRIAEAHASLGLVYSRQWRWREAEQEFKLALALKPGYASAHHWYALLLFDHLRRTEALREIRAAQRLDPLSPVITGVTGIMLWAGGDIAGARHDFERMLELSPDFGSGHEWVASFDAFHGRCAEGIAHADHAVEVLKRANEALGTQAAVYARCGRRQEAESIVAELRQKARTSAANTAIAFAASGLGDRDEAIRWLEKAYRERDGDLGPSFYRPQIDVLRADPRVRAILRGMGLPDGPQFVVPPDTPETR